MSFKNEFEKWGKICVRHPVPGVHPPLFFPLHNKVREHYLLFYPLSLSAKVKVTANVSFFFTPKILQKYLQTFLKIFLFCLYPLSSRSIHFVKICEFLPE
jgi:hypothetical protein